MDDCRLQADSLDDVLSVGAWASENRHETCCARLDDLDWVVLPYDPDMILPGREMYVEIPDVDRDICILPDEFPVVVDKTAVEPLSLPVVVKMRPHVGCDPDLYLSEWYVEVDNVDTRQHIRNLPGVVPAMFDETAPVVHDLEEEELPFVAMNELGCLRLDWPKTLFTFMSRYQFDLDKMRKDCRERFGSTQSLTCAHCGKHIQQNLGKHIALYHMELAQLWRCPVTWCTVWKGTAQNCVDHMRRAHDISPLMKAANLARWFPPWTVSREQWSSMSRLAVSGRAVYTLLFSRIGVPLFHRYQVVNRAGTHGAFRGSYMRWMHAFLEESDMASLRRRHRRCARDIAARMSRTSILDRTPDISNRPKVYRRSVSRTRRPTRPMVLDGSSVASGPVRPHCSEVHTIQALMDLALPRFEGLGNGPQQVHRPWMMSTESPASPDPGCLMEFLRPQSPCLNLDALSSDDMECSVGLSNLSVTLLCDSYEGHTPVNSDQVLWDEDLPPTAGSEDSRQVVRIRDVSPDVQIVDVSQVGRE